MTTNQEGKHTPEQILEREAGEIFPLHSYPGNSIEGGKLYKQLQKAYIAGGHSILASQSSELSKLRELRGQFVKPASARAIEKYPVLEDTVELPGAGGGSFKEDINKNLRTGYEEGYIDALFSAMDSLTEREQEVERLNKLIQNLNDDVANLSEDNATKDKELSELNELASKRLEDITNALNVASTLREYNRELFEYLKYLRPFLTKAGRDTGGIDALISKSKPTE